MDKPLTTEEIKALLEDQPRWLGDARRQHAEERDATSAQPESTDDE